VKTDKKKVQMIGPYLLMNIIYKVSMRSGVIRNLSWVEEGDGHFFTMIPIYRFLYIFIMYNIKKKETKKRYSTEYFNIFK